MRVIMLIEIPDPVAFADIDAHLQDKVDSNKIDGYFTLCTDGYSQGDLLPDHMDSEKRLSDWIAAFEKLIIKTKKENTNATQQ